jgi:NADPH-dependent glutamate synthase beta subunit-like oxidoreductase
MGLPAAGRASGLGFFLNRFCRAGGLNCTADTRNRNRSPVSYQRLCTGVQETTSRLVSNTTNDTAVGRTGDHLLR